MIQILQLQRIIKLLEMTAFAGRPVSVARLQAATELPRPTCYRLVQTLTKHGLLDVSEQNGHYVIGERLTRLALLGRSDIDIRRAAATVIKDAAIYVGDAIFLARLRAHHVEIIHVETPDDATSSFVHPGLGDRPVHACSSAKVIMAFADPELQDEILDSTFERFNANTLRSRQALIDEFKKIAQCGYAVCDQEIQQGVSSVAAPVKFREIGVTFSVGAVGFSSKYDATTCAELGGYLSSLAPKVESAIQLCNVSDVQCQ